MARSGGSFPRALPALAIAAAATAVFANSLANEFVYDDVPAIEENARLDHPLSPGTFLATPYWGDRDPRNENRLYRPLTLYSFALDRALLGRGPFGVHLTNVVLNALIAVLVYAFVLELSGCARLAWVSALLFALHPVHTEVVANGVGRSELLVALFVFATALLHLRLLRATARRGPLLAVSACLYLLAMLAKESAVVLPGLLLLADWLVVEGGLWRPVASRRGLYLAYAAPLALYLALRFAVVGTGTPAVPLLLSTATEVQRLLHASETLLRQLGQLVLPIGLSADYADYRRPILPSLRDPFVLTSVLAWPALAGACVMSFRRGVRLPVFGLAWFGLSILPVSNVLVPIGTLRADRLLFLPSFGIALSLAWALVALTRRRRALAWGILVLLLAFYGGRSYLRNRDWRSNETLWTADLRTNPGSAIGWASLGLTRRERGDVRGAEEAYRRAIDLRWVAGFSFPAAQNDLAALLLERGERALAIAEYRRVLARNPDQLVALTNLGEILMASADTRAEAIAMLERAIQLDPANISPRGGLAQAYSLEGRHTAALEMVEQALALAPGEPRLWAVKRQIRARLRQEGREPSGL